MEPRLNDPPEDEPARSGPVLLLVEDSPADADAVFWAAGKALPGVVVHHVETLEAAVAHPERNRVDCLLLDPGLPGFVGLGALEELRRRNHRGPVVVLTGNLDRDLAVEALGAGAQEFLTKDEVGPREFRRAVRYAIERHRGVDELAEAKSRLENLQALLAHDLRRPMTVVAHAVHLLRRSDLPPEQVAPLLDRCEEAAGSMQQMVDDLLSFAGQRMPEILPCPLGDVAGAVAQELGPSVKESGGTLHIDSGLPAVLASPIALRHVLRNLVTNALDHRHRARPPAIRIGAVRAGGRCELRVVDNGPGIPVAERDREFDIGVRLGDQPVRGLGLGLAAVRTLAGS